MYDKYLCIGSEGQTPWVRSVVWLEMCEVGEAGLFVCVVGRGMGESKAWFVYHHIRRTIVCQVCECGVGERGIERRAKPELYIITSAG